jgi:hypothetical protein
MKRRLLPLLLAFLPLLARGQETAVRPDSSEAVVYDTVKVWYTQEDRPEKQVPDSTLQGFWRYNPANQGLFEYGHLGNFGSPAYSLTYNPTLRRGFFTGLEQFELYRIRPSDLRFYQSRYPFTELFYTQAGQANSTVQARFGHQFPGGLNLSVEYRLINQTGQYANQRARLENLCLGGRYESPDKRYVAYFGYVNNKFRHQENGGLQDPTDLDGPVSFPATLPVQLSTAQTNHRHNELFWHHSFSPWSDSTGFGGRIHHRLNWRSEWYKFHDVSPAQDSSFYGLFQTNDRGIRHFLHVRSLTNSLWYEQRLGKKALVFEAGLEHVFLDIDHEPQRTRAHTLFATGSLRTHPDAPNWIRFSAKGHLGLVGQAGDLGLTTNLRLQWPNGRWGALEGELLFQSYTPALVHRELLVSQAEVWRNDFNKTQELVLGGAYVLTSLHFRAGIRSCLVGNLIYYDDQARAAQRTQALAFVQLYADHLLKIWKFRWQNRVVWQPTRAAELPLPEWQIRSNLAFETRIFKKRMLFQIGLDARWQSSFQGYAYFPVLGQFYLQNGQNLSFLPLVDAYAAFRVKRFRVFLMGENLTQDLYKKGHFLVPDYPVPFRQIRFGVSWYLSS